MPPKKKLKPDKKPTKLGLFLVSTAFSAIRQSTDVR
jgi:hypothetical protein